MAWAVPRPGTLGRPGDPIREPGRPRKEPYELGWRRIRPGEPEGSLRWRRIQAEEGQGQPRARRCWGRTGDPIWGPGRPRDEPNELRRRRIRPNVPAPWDGFSGAEETRGEEGFPTGNQPVPRKGPAESEAEDPTRQSSAGEDGVLGGGGAGRWCVGPPGHGGGVGIPRGIPLKTVLRR